MSSMYYLWATILVVLNLAFLGLNVLGLPGNWLVVFATGAFAWWQWEGGRSVWDQTVSLHVLLIVLVLAAAGEVIEFIAGSAGSRKAGASRWASLGAIVGSLMGLVLGTVLIPIPFVGSLIGACVGAFAAAALIEMALGRPVKPSLMIGTAAGTGRLAGTLAKIALGVVIWLISTVAVYWP